MKVIGLTGGIGSGKTTVANFFSELGVPVFIADKVAKSLYNQKEVINLIKQTFGEHLFKENKLDRQALASIVFNNSTKLNKLNKIIHPRVHYEFENWLKQQNSSYVIYEAAIIFEHNRQNFFDKIILVTAPKSTRINRVMSRDGISESQVLERICQQWPDEKKANLTDFVVINVDLEKTKARVQEIDNLLKNS
ncbi:dephospho-CoA kinase [Psychroflexus sp. ALD_RP9]|uniref:dephospho-CoA kinase n=1 Tax=Psychroflexus sp. ALD_RP9 TaxID=2777186 RepID=UPI001A8F3736|nr:dephospho-CoA kinase [Psychroflexus sp. ALD_RP9]QSS96796.1 dephospho-CoA kinase [Psychroflexus sp. ALD_RP9]